MRPRRQLKPLRKFEYPLVMERMDGLLINVDRDLRRRGKEALRLNNHEAERCLVLLNIIVRFARNSYDAARYLTGDTPEDSRRRLNYALILPAINRQLLDLLFSLVYMLDDFGPRSLQYQKAGWRELREEYHLYKTRFSREPEWKDHFNNVRNSLSELVTRFHITSKEQANPKLIPFWKTPSQLKDEKTYSRPFLRYLEQWIYADTSAQAHLSFGGLFMVAPFLVAEFVGGQDEELVNSRVIQQYRFQHFSRTAITTLAIATEIDVYCRLGNLERAAYLWNIFAEYCAEAKEMLQHRYSKLLETSTGPKSA